MTRGVRNKNPFNIRKSSNAWKGKVISSDSAFEQFSNVEYGVRAGLTLLRNYSRKGYNTINKIISRYAPATENATANYINYVANQCRVDKNIILDLGNKDMLYDLCKAICMYESSYLLTRDVFNKALSL